MERRAGPSATADSLILWLFQRFTSVLIGNESVRKIIISDTIIFFRLKIAISILVNSNHNSLRVPFDKIASVHFI